MLREFFLGFIKLHVIYHAAQGVFGLQLIQELARHGYHLPPGTLAQHCANWSKPAICAVKND